MSKEEPRGVLTGFLTGFPCFSGGFLPTASQPFLLVRHCLAHSSGANASHNCVSGWDDLDLHVRHVQLGHVSCCPSLPSHIFTFTDSQSLSNTSVDIALRQHIPLRVTDSPELPNPESVEQFHSPPALSYRLSTIPLFATSTNDCHRSEPTIYR